MGLKSAIYCRVSSDEQLNGYSIPAQERACLDYCQQHDWEIVGKYVDEGKSAHTDAIVRRPAFRALLDAVSANKVEAIVVHKFDRFSRSMSVTVEVFRLLSQANCGFVSITEQFDYTTPQGRLFLHMLAALADFYSQNLSLETKKGKAERKAQGLYNGLLPFGVMKGDDGLPQRDTRRQANDSTNYDGLLLAFHEAAEGKTDKEIAVILNSKGYRSTGNRGFNPFRKDSVRRILMNRFYLGELPDGKGGRIPGKHEAILPAELFEQAQRAREQNRKVTAKKVNGKGRTFSLTGLLRCFYCEQSNDSRPTTMRIRAKEPFAPRVVCYSRDQGFDCPQRSVPLTMYESQVEKWLENLELPENLIEQALSRYAAEAKTVSEPDKERGQLERRLERLKELYAWGDIERTEYTAQRDRIARRLRVLAPPAKQERDLRKLADFVSDVKNVWQVATQAQRNSLLTKLVEKITVRDGLIVAIVPKPDLSMLVPESVNFEYPEAEATGFDVPSGHPRYLVSRNWLPDSLYRELAEKSRSNSISQLARDYHTSRQTVRKAIRLFGHHQEHV